MTMDHFLDSSKYEIFNALGIPAHLLLDDNPTTCTSAKITQPLTMEIMQKAINDLQKSIYYQEYLRTTKAIERLELRRNILREWKVGWRWDWC